LDASMPLPLLGSLPFSTLHAVGITKKSKVNRNLLKSMSFLQFQIIPKAVTGVVIGWHISKLNKF
ncbi:MAG: hypothetical protein NTZ90_01205, partial [Proteobacteria bacterium]|nr:hypothetical protein [Pseudomonadota bacterium]